MKKAVLAVEAFLKAPVACLAVRGELGHVKKVYLKKIKIQENEEPKIMWKLSTTKVRMKPASCADSTIFHVSHSLLFTLSIGVPP